MFYFSREQLEEIIFHAKKEAPLEACGILAGNKEKVLKVYKMENIEKSPVSFFMDPKEQIKVLKEIRNLGLEMVGIYHSHPQSDAYPSAKDISLAFYPEVSYVIISLKDKEPLVRSFKIKEGKVEEEKIEIE